MPVAVDDQLPFGTYVTTSDPVTSEEIDPEPWQEPCGTVSETVTVSSPHPLTAVALFPSPVYDAVQLHVPEAFAAAEFVVEYEPLPDTVTVSVYAGTPEQSVCAGS